MLVGYFYLYLAAGGLPVENKKPRVKKSTVELKISWTERGKNKKTFPDSRSNLWWWHRRSFVRIMSAQVSRWSEGGRRHPEVPRGKESHTPNWTLIFTWLVLDSCWEAAPSLVLHADTAICVLTRVINTLTLRLKKKKKPCSFYTGGGHRWVVGEKWDRCGVLWPANANTATGIL